MLSAERYRIERVIAEGRTAEVLEAVAVGREGFERRVALKRLLPESAFDEPFIEGFIDEARIASRLHHANIVAVLDFGLMDGVPFQVLELVDGVDVERLLDRCGPLPVEIALHIATEIGHALAHAHEAEVGGASLGIVHRDVKPGNILVSKGGDVKLGDFGIARATQRLAETAAGYAKGTLGYMAPEQALSMDVDRRVDIFSLGCVLFALINGRSPFHSEELRRRFLSERILTFDRDLPSDVAPIVERALRYDRHQRHASARDFVAETGKSLAKRLDRDPRSALIDFMQGHLKEPAATRPGDLLDIARLLDEVSGIPRFASVAREEITETTAPAPISDDREPSSSGKVEGSYRIEEPLGRGGMAEVYRARHVVLDREYAIKILRGRMSSVSLAKRLEREARLLGKIDHPNVVKVHDCGTTASGRPFIVMELLRGRLLSDVVKTEGPLDPARAIRIARQIAQGLGAAHAEGIVHRDLKPGNIMLVGQPAREAVKILDFGIGRAVDDHAKETRLTSADHLLGTPSFMAPEQIRSASNAGASADLYALGAIIYAMITGRPPFIGARAAVLDQQMSRMPDSPPETMGLGPLAMALLEKDPVARPASAREVEARLDALAVEEPTVMATATRVLEGRGFWRKATWLFIPPGAALGLLAVALLRSWKEPAPIMPKASPEAPAVIASPRHPPVEPASAGEEPDPPVDAPLAVRRRRVRADAAPIEDVERELDRILRGSGLTVVDLSADPAAASAMAQWTESRSPESKEAVRGHVDRIAGDPSTLRHKLDAIRLLLAGVEDPALFENRYLDLRAREVSAKTDTERRGIARAAAGLAAEITRAD